MGEPDLGKMAEKRVSLWASEARITCTKVDEDEKGWDFMFEISADDQPGTWFDADPADMCCLVQVKGVRSGRARNDGVRLTNWQHFVRSPLPCFFVIVEFDHDNEAAALFVVHVGEHWIAKAMKRLRLEAARETPRNETERRRGGKKRVKSLNQLRMSLTWNASAQIPPPWHTNLRRYIVETVEDQHEYARKKMTWYESLGYEDARYGFTIRFGDKDNDALSERQAEFAVGLADRLPLESSVVYERRFGIERVLDRHQGGGYMESPDLPPICATQATIETVSTGESVTLECETYASWTLFPRLPKKFQKLRFVAPCSSIVITGGRKVRCHFDPFNVDRENLSALAKAARALRLIAQESGRGELIFTFTVRGQSRKVSYTANTAVKADLLGDSRVLERAWHIARFFDLGDPKVDPRDLLRQDLRIALMYSVVTPTLEPISIQSTLADDPRDPDSEPSALGFAVCVPVIFGETACLCSFALSGQAVWSDGDANVVVGIEDAVPRALRTRVVVEGPFDAAIDELRSAAAEQLEADGVETIIEI